MTNTNPAPGAEMTHAVETLVTHLEREHAWAVELRNDLAHTEREIAKLLTACDAAIHAMPTGRKTGFLIRCAKISPTGRKAGRPMADARYHAMLDYIAKRPDEEVTTAEIRAHLKRHSLRHTSQYVSNQMHRWAHDGMVVRTGHGRYRVDGQNDRLSHLRMKPPTNSHRAAIRQEIADGRAQAEARFDKAVSDDQARQKAQEYETLRRKNFYSPPSEWDPNHPEYKGPGADAVNPNVG